MLVNLKTVLNMAEEGGYCIPAFNVYNMETVMGVLKAAEEMRAPIIMQVYPRLMKEETGYFLSPIIKAAAQKATVPVCFHLDHGPSELETTRSLRYGATGIMLDGSLLPFEENIDVSARVAAVAHPNNIPVEAELGKVGGKEDDLEAVADTNTDPAEAKEFVEKTGIDSLAVAIGTAHGFYVGTPVLDKERLSEIRAVVDIPLVLHGASGLSDEDVKDCVKRGICKVNFATELRVAYTDAGKALLKEKPETFDPKKLGEVGMAAVTELVKNRMKVCGCDGKAI